MSIYGKAAQFLGKVKGSNGFYADKILWS